MRLRDETPGFGVSLIKAGLRLRGLDVGSVRPPLVDPTPDAGGRLGAILDAGLALAERLGDGGGCGDRADPAASRRAAASACRSSRPWGPDVRDLSLVEVVVEDSDGDRGYGFSWTPSIGAAAVQAHLDHDIAAFAVGRDADADVALGAAVAAPARGRRRRHHDHRAWPASTSRSGTSPRAAPASASPTTSVVGTRPPRSTAAA